MSTPQTSVARLGFVGALCSILLLTGCATPPDAQTTHDSLTEITESPEADQDPLDELPEPLDLDPRDCTPYLVITVRGTGEPHRGQLLSPVARAIEDARPDDVDVLDLDYPASTEMKESGTEGLQLLVATLNVQAEACPVQQSVLLGYSQGALIIGDALTVPEYRIVGEKAGVLSAHAMDQVSSIVLYGDPRFVGTETFNSGFFNPDISGLLPRPLDALEQFEDRIRDFCTRRDFVCQATTDLDETGHVEYFDNGMQDEGAKFVISRLDPPAAARRQ